MAAKTIEEYSKDYYAAKAAGDAVGMKAANDAANAIRASQGQAAQDASVDIANVSEAASKGQAGTGGSTQTASQNYQTQQTQKSPTSQSAYVKALYKAQQEAALKELKSAYDQNVISLDATAAKIPGMYQAAKNQTAGTAAVNQANFNESAAASGLNSGAGSQVALSQSNALMGNLSTLNANEAQAKTDLETERLRIQTAYKNDIAKAISSGQLAQAQALYNEAMRVDEGLVNSSYQQANLDLQRQSQQFSQDKTNQSMLMQQAEMLAAYGDFSGYRALGIPDAQIAQMQAVWRASNPKIMAAMVGGGGGSYGSGSSGYTGGQSDSAQVSAELSKFNATVMTNAEFSRHGGTDYASYINQKANEWYSNGLLSADAVTKLIQTYGLGTGR